MSMTLLKVIPKMASHRGRLSKTCPMTGRARNVVPSKPILNRWITDVCMGTPQFIGCAQAHQNRSRGFGRIVAISNRHTGAGRYPEVGPKHNHINYPQSKQCRFLFPIQQSNFVLQILKVNTIATSCFWIPAYAGTTVF